MLDPKKLKQIALTKRKEKDNSVKENLAPEQYDSAVIAQWIKELEDYVINFAEDGYLFVDYMFKPEHSIQTLYAVAQGFRQENPRLMLIVDEGQKKITVSWDGNNHV